MPRRRRPSEGPPEGSDVLPGSSRAALEAERLSRRAIQRAHLIESAVAVIQREGAGASMDQMAAQAGVTKPILYRHFSDRAGLVSAVAEFAFTRVSEGLEAALHANASARELVASTIDTYLVFIETDPNVYRFLVQRSVSEAGVSINEYIWRTSRQVATVLGEALRAAGLDSGPAEAWAFGIVGMVHASGDWWLDRGTMPRARLTDYLTSLVCDGLPDLSSLGRAESWLPGAGDTNPPAPPANPPAPPATPVTNATPSDAGDTSSIQGAGDTSSIQGAGTHSVLPTDAAADVLPIAAAEARRSS